MSSGTIDALNCYASRSHNNLPILDYLPNQWDQWDQLRMPLQFLPMINLKFSNLAHFQILNCRIRIVFLHRICKRIGINPSENVITIVQKRHEREFIFVSHDNTFYVNRIV